MRDGVEHDIAFASSGQVIISDGHRHNTLPLLNKYKATYEVKPMAGNKYSYTDQCVQIHAALSR